ncbi:hypothetical protein QJS04_geneDACA016416 [Acorus gramineus]|uniref:DUF7912 domain-containing protein n=1 Tax=Acorus gramineus TaxID=55184 RepID=A0AAV8ZX34_ACOGR|nr:hypothetical protein QJS04_geneDACA016416 [Acorus gramineus]
MRGWCLKKGVPALTLRCLLLRSSSLSPTTHPHFHPLCVPPTNQQPPLRFFSSITHDHSLQQRRLDEQEEEEEEEEEWEEEWEDDYEDSTAEPQIGDGGDGGGVVLRNVGWGERALSAAREVLHTHFGGDGGDFTIYAFKTSPSGYVYVRLDKLSNRFGCPSIEEIESFNRLYMKQLEEFGEQGEIPAKLALEVSSPGAERILKVPTDLERFKDMPMNVLYLEEKSETKYHEAQGVFMVDEIETESGHCIWRLANVKENRDALGKGRPLSRKQKDWRLRVPFTLLKRVMLYIES